MDAALEKTYRLRSICFSRFLFKDQGSRICLLRRDAVCYHLTSVLPGGNVGAWNQNGSQPKRPLTS
jgi:hypothetical protein